MDVILKILNSPLSKRLGYDPQKNDSVTMLKNRLSKRIRDILSIKLTPLEYDKNMRKYDSSNNKYRIIWKGLRPISKTSKNYGLKSNNNITVNSIQKQESEHRGRWTRGQKINSLSNRQHKISDYADPNSIFGKNTKDTSKIKTSSKIENTSFKRIKSFNNVTGLIQKYNDDLDNSLSESYYNENNNNYTFKNLKHKWSKKLHKSNQERYLMENFMIKARTSERRHLIDMKFSNSIGIYKESN